MMQDVDVRTVITACAKLPYKTVNFNSVICKTAFHLIPRATSIPCIAF